MNRPSRVVIVVALLVVVGISSFAVVLFLNSQRATVNFVPERANTIPGETGWFIAEIDVTWDIADYEIVIQTNASIDTEYTFWPETPLIEVFVYPNESHVESCIEVELVFSAGSVVARDTALLRILNWTFEGLEEIIEKRDVFIDFIAADHPEFGIDNTTIWTPIYNCAGILIVGHHLFKSAQWEMEVSWHVMVAPHDWVKVYLRPRGQVAPSWAATIESWNTDNGNVVEMAPPAQVYRPM